MRGLRISLIGLVFACAADAASATEISYTLSNVSGEEWQYAFTVANNSLAVPIGEFTLFFDYHTFDNLASVSEPAQYAGPVVVQPVVPVDPLFPVAQDGFFDYLASDAGLPPGGSTGLFIVDVDFLGHGTPGAPTFTVVDANFNTIDSGSTSPERSSVPEPATLALLGFGMLAALLWVRRPRRA
jgi:hypothetical protein